MCFEHFFPILHNILHRTLFMTLVNTSLGVLTWSSSLRLRRPFDEAMQGFAGVFQEADLSLSISSAIRPDIPVMPQADTNISQALSQSCFLSSYENEFISLIFVPKDRFTMHRIFKVALSLDLKFSIRPGLQHNRCPRAMKNSNQISFLNTLMHKS
jgi:hypothetical protein